MAKENGSKQQLHILGNKIRFKRRNGTRKQGFTYVGEQVCKVNMKLNTKLDRNNDRKKNQSTVH